MMFFIDQKHKPIFFSVLGLLAIGGLVYLVWPTHTSQQAKQVPCTMEVKICPDGSAVGRIGPNCEFAPCPENNQNDATASWKIYQDSARNIEFKYPAELGTKFESPQEWPPKITVTDGTFSCQESDQTSSLPARTVKRTISGRDFCIMAQSEGAAGSTYTDYSYTTEQGDKLFFLSFTIRYPQCLNYDDPDKSNCEKERETFNLDDLIGQIAGTVKLNDQ